MFDRFINLAIDAFENFGEQSPILIVIAGHNGAGKSTCYREYLKEGLGVLATTHIDPDVVEKDIRSTWVGPQPLLNEFSEMAMVEAAGTRKRLLASGGSFSFETVFSDPVGDKLSFMQKALNEGYFVVFIFVGLDSPQKSSERVLGRVKRGGHNVPQASIFSRYPRVISNATKAVKIASAALLIDNSQDSIDPNIPCYEPFAIYKNGSLVERSEDIPAWATSFQI